jgi:hypothetical protein
MKKTMRLTESDLTRLVKRVIKEQNNRQFIFPIDVVISDGSLINPKKITIPKGSIMKYNQNGVGQVKVGNMNIIYNPNDNGGIISDQYGLTLKVNNQDYILQWADSLFGIVYNKEYQKIGNTI